MRNRWLATALVATVLAASGALAGGSDSKGKFFFKKNCKSCHVKGGAGGEVTPLSKTQEQWKRYFGKGTHNKGTQKLTDVVPAEQLEHIETFLFNHAADSPQPETCG